MNSAGAEATASLMPSGSAPRSNKACTAGKFCSITASVMGEFFPPKFKPTPALCIISSSSTDNRSSSSRFSSSTATQYCRQAIPASSTGCQSAPASSRTSIAPTCFFWQACISGVAPLVLRALRLAFDRQTSRIIRVPLGICGFCAKTCSKDMKSSLHSARIGALTDAPACVSRRTKPRSFFKAASCRSSLETLSRPRALPLSTDSSSKSSNGLTSNFGGVFAGSRGVMLGTSAKLTSSRDLRMQVDYLWLAAALASSYHRIRQSAPVGHWQPAISV
mmetsp:Transcript_46316/g.110242  ORF Transcript_46316/g.110242 Transcript_46316/m.110242 type:complete len:277 (-) Transcript_46316:24-854(-)